MAYVLTFQKTSRCMAPAHPPSSPCKWQKMNPPSPLLTILVPQPRQEASAGGVVPSSAAEGEADAINGEDGRITKTLESVAVVDSKVTFMISEEEQEEAVAIVVSAGKTTINLNAIAIPL